jgi:hypothetical protein
MIVSNARRLGHLVGCLHLHLHRNCSQLSGKSHSLSSPQKLSLNLIVPPSREVETISFGDMTALIDYLSTFNGSLCIIDSAGKKESIPRKQYKALSPLQTYEIH